MANKAKWISQYPRRKNPQEIITVHDQLHAATKALHEAEYTQAKAMPTSLDAVLQQFAVIQEAMSQLQEAADMFSDLFKFDRGAAKAQYLKANQDCFYNPEEFLETEDEQ